MLHFSAASQGACIESNPAPTTPDPPRATQPPDGRSATRAIPTLMGGAPAPDTKELLVVAILHSLPYPRSVPRFHSPHRRRQPPRRSRRSGRWEGSVRDSGPGAHEPLVSIHPVFLCSIPGCVRFPGRFQDSAPKVQHEIENLLFAHHTLVH